jgi:predicted amidohydrolase
VKRSLLLLALCAALAQAARPVRVLSLSFRDRPLDEICALIDQEAAKGVDIVVLPETWRGQNERSMEPLDGPTITALSALARKHHTWIVSPIDRLDGARRLNTAVLLDRSGKVAALYDKVYPFWSEFDLQPKVEVGRQPLVVQTDFGRLGLAICFDTNFPSLWQAMADQGAEIILWPSAYSAGTSLQAHALNHHFYIVTSTLKRDCIVYDITGEEILYRRSAAVTVTHVTLDLDRVIFHEDFNLAKRDKLLQEHGAEVELEKKLDREAWFVLRSRTPSASARALARQYGLEELRDYLRRSRLEIDRLR